MAVSPATISELVLRELENRFLSATGLFQQILVAFLIQEAWSSRMVLFQAGGYMCAGGLFPISRQENASMNQYSIPLWTNWNSQPKCLLWSKDSIWSKLKCLSSHVHKALNHSLHTIFFFLQKDKRKHSEVILFKYYILYYIYLKSSQSHKTHGRCKECKLWNVNSLLKIIVAFRTRK